MELTLGAVIGRALKSVGGLRHLHLPEGVEVDHASRIVEAANAARPANPPFAFLVSSALVADPDPQVPVVSGKGTVQFRRGNHVAVVHGRLPDLASFSQAFTELLGQSYPEQAKGFASLENVASMVVTVLAEETGATFTKQEFSTAVDIVSRCLTSVHVLHRSSQEGLRSWNSVWFDHADTGIRNLARLVGDLAMSGSKDSLPQVIQKFGPACFGLPTEGGRGSRLPTSSVDARNFTTALLENWSDSDRFTVSSQLLNNTDLSMSSPHSLSQMDAAELDGFVAAANDVWLGLAGFIGGATNRVLAFSDLTVGQFLDPDAGSHSGGTIQIFSMSGQDLALSEGSNSPPYLVPVFPVSASELFESERLELRMPTRGQATRELLEASDITITLTPKKNLEWTTEEVAVGDRFVSFFGCFRSKARADLEVEAFQHLNVFLNIPLSDCLAPLLTKSLSCTVQVYRPDETFLALFPLRVGNRVSKAIYIGRTWESDTETEFIHDVVSSTKGFIALLCWPGAGAGQGVSLDERPLDLRSGESKLYTTKFIPSGNHEFAAGYFRFFVRAQAAGKGQQSPVLAAAVKEQIAQERPDASTEASFLGCAENFFAQRIVNGCPDLIMSLGHVMMPSDRPDRIQDVVPCDGGTVLMSEGSRSALNDESFATFEHEHFVKGPEAQRFREALEALKLGELFIRSDANGDDSVEWPSRTSFRRLWGTDELAEYLKSYTELIAAARRLDNEEMVFWATYPMAVSIWDVTVASGDTSVLLSPLHPLRLAWLAGVEHTLYESELAVNLIGSIEGWGFPLVGPGQRVNRRLIAVPIDSGEDQVFLGWSLLVPAGTEEPRAVVAPNRIGSHDAPGSAVGGLNSASVDSALRAFRKMHPYISTLTVDLSAKKRQNRLTEIDQSVLSLAREWSQQADGRLEGGVRVFDSVMRDGPAPHDRVTRLVRENGSMLLTWSRYEPQDRQSLSCHVRFLQDAGSTIQVRGGGRNHGAMGPVPLRRFVAASGELDRRLQSPTDPGIASEVGWQPFSGALAAVENADSPPLVSAGMLRRDLEDVSADWTVLGETFMSPTVMGSLMDTNAKSSKMLWEWRPPVLDRRTKLPVVDRRPFVSIARVPDTFGTQLDEFLARATGQSATSDLRRRIMSTLGHRGVGLSSLLSMGGTHVAGAIGFYLAFSLLDKLDHGNSARFIIPIDASDYFLRTLARDDEHSRGSQRADLLLIDVNDHEVCLTPVEVKCNGLVSSSEVNPSLPGSNAYKVDRACDQLAVSQSLLERVRSESERVQGADRDLWFNSLTTLVEAASRLSPLGVGSPESLADRLARIASGRVSVRVGVPILTYFQRTGVDGPDGAFYVGPVGGQGRRFDGLIASTETAFTSLASDDCALMDAWANYFRPSRDEELQRGQLSSDEKAPGAMASVRALEDGGQKHPADWSSSLADGTESGDTERCGPPSGGGIQGDGVRFAVGRIINSIGRAEAHFWPSNTDLNQLNIGVVGDLGTGKTELVKALIAQVRQQTKLSQASVPTSMLIFDVKGDFQDPEFLKTVGGVVLEPHNIPLSVFLNVRTSDYSTRPHKQAAGFSDTLKKIYRGIGPVQDSSLKAVIRGLFESSQGAPPTLDEILESYRANAASADSVTAILEDFVHGEIFCKDKDKLRPFADLLEGRVLVVALDKLGQDQSAKNALVALFLNLYYDYMLSLEKLPFLGERPQLRYLKSFLIIDEAINIMRYDFEVLMNLMLQGRQFGVGVVLASQYLSHFRESKVNYGQPLRTWFIHKVPQVSSKELESLGLPNLAPDVARRIPTLGQHEVLYKSSGGDEGLFVRVHPYYELKR